MDVQDLPDYLQAIRHRIEDAAGVGISEPTQTAAVSSIDEQERLLVMQAMTQSHGNQSEAARILRIGRDALRYKLKKFGIDYSPASR